MFIYNTIAIALAVGQCKTSTFKVKRLIKYSLSVFYLFYVGYYFNGIKALNKSSKQGSQI